MAHAWKACWCNSLTSSNLVFSAIRVSGFPETLFSYRKRDSLSTSSDFRCRDINGSQHDNSAEYGTRAVSVRSGILQTCVSARPQNHLPDITTLDNMYPMGYTIYMEIRMTGEYRKWFRKIRDHNAKARINARLRLCIEAGKPVGDLHTVGAGVSELRFSFGPGYRVYFAQKGNVLMLLLIGGDKSTQSRDIEQAKEMLEYLNKENQW